MMKEIEGIVFGEHHLGPGNYQAIILCRDGVEVSIIQCDGTGEFCARLRFDGTERGCFYGNTSGENVFEVWDYVTEDPLGYQTSADVVRCIIEHGGIDYQKDVPHDN